MRPLTPALAAARAGPATILPTGGGFTCVHAEGRGPPVVLVHGMTSPSLVWERVAPLVAAGGRRVVRYDLYGRGLSARPATALTPVAYHQQLDEVIAATCAAPPVVVGYSWGAGLVASWAAEGAARGTAPRTTSAATAPPVARLVLVAPGGLAGDWTTAALRRPVLGDLLVALTGRRGLRADLDRMFRDPGTAADYAPRFAPQLDWEGYDRCFLSTLRHCPPTWEEAYAALGRTPTRVDVLWGDEDRKVPHALARRLTELVPQATVRLVPGGAHGMPWEAPERVGEALIELLGDP